MEATRELPLPPLPFIVIYRVLERADAVENCQCHTRIPALAAGELGAEALTNGRHFEQEGFRALFRDS
jgi:hypothetical protein